MTQLEFLNDTIAYYSVDPVNRRCTDKEGNCKYSPKTVNKVGLSEGCAIGRKLPPNVQVLLDSSSYGSIDCIKRDDPVKYDKLPEWMKEFPILFLEAVQRLHDNAAFWTDTGLSESGIAKVNEIKQRFNLN